jgi:hypothetical protein
MVAAASWLDAYPAWTSPLTNHTGGADFSVFMGALFGGGAYWLLARRSVPAETQPPVVQTRGPAAQSHEPIVQTQEN